MNNSDLLIFNGNSKDTEKSSFNLFAENDTNKEFATILDNEAFIKNVIKTNPEKGFELIFKRYYAPLCNHAIKFVYSKEIAEDMVSEIFSNFWIKKSYETITGRYRSYLYQALRNNIYGYLRNEYAKNPDFLNSQQEDSFECNTPQKILLFQELNNKIDASIKSFSPQCQKVFLLSRVEGKKNREIADMMNLKIKTVEAHMMKALYILKNSLSAYLK